MKLDEALSIVQSAIEEATGRPVGELAQAVEIVRKRARLLVVPRPLAHALRDGKFSTAVLFVQPNERASLRALLECCANARTS